MRPMGTADGLESRPRKSSIADASNLTDRTHHTPTTFFLSRDIDNNRTTAHSPPNVSTLQETLDEANGHSAQAGLRGGIGEGRGDNRRRSTIRAVNSNKRIRRPSSPSDGSGHSDRLHTSLLLSAEPSFPSSPKSFSSRSLVKSDDGLTTDDNSSQAVVSSEDDEEMGPSVITQDSQPELIMPSIKMPSRRPFTTRGKGLGRYKILVAGRKGVGKTSLIKSIVQVCEDIVHVDPLLSTPSDTHPVPSEIYASTKPYPKWWTDLDESRVLRRRKSMGDSVLERNICFVDMPDESKTDQVIRYLEQQLVRAISSMSGVGQDLPNLLGGRGGTQVDVVLYIISQDTFTEDCQSIQQLSEIANVIPLLAKSDLLSDEERRLAKQNMNLQATTFPQFSDRQDMTITAPYTITSINGPDSDNMDASLLMSSEYIQPLLPSELHSLVDHLFDAETVDYLRHTAARKLCSWHAKHPRLARSPSPSVQSNNQSTLGSPIPTSLTHSGVLIPATSELSLTTSNSLALTKLADHSQREERLAQVRLSKWASDLQISLQREREKFERLARGERANWLVERMREEVRDGQIVAVEKPFAGARTSEQQDHLYDRDSVYQIQDPLGLLHWQEAVRARGWIALQIVGSFGVVGGLAVWFARTWGLTSTWNEWTRGWGGEYFAQESV